MSEGLLKVQDTGKAIILKLNNPSTKNALSPDVLKLLHQHIIDIPKSNDTSRILVITGEGDSFSAGADLKYLSQLPQTCLKERISNCQLVVELIRDLYLYPYPVIAAVNGAAIGAATAIIAVADLVIAKDGILMGNPELSIGFAPFVTFTAIALKVGLESALRIVSEGVVQLNKDRRHPLIDVISDKESFSKHLEHAINKFNSINLHSFSKLKSFARKKRWEEFKAIFDKAIELNAREYETSDFAVGLNKFLEKMNYKRQF